MKKNNLIGSKIALGLGVLILASSTLNNNTSGNHTSFITGNLMILGSLAYMARRKQNKQPSKKWRVTEIISIIIILYFTTIGIISGGWYQNPVPFVITPLWFAIAYIVAFRAGKKINTLPIAEDDRETKQENLLNLEKLAELKEKGVITESEFEAKKKKILEKI